MVWYEGFEGFEQEPDDKIDLASKNLVLRAVKRRNIVTTAQTWLHDVISHKGFQWTKINMHGSVSLAPFVRRAALIGQQFGYAASAATVMGKSCRTERVHFVSSACQVYCCKLVRACFCLAKLVLTHMACSSFCPDIVRSEKIMATCVAATNFT